MKESNRKKIVNYIEKEKVENPDYILENDQELCEEMDNGDFSYDDLIQLFLDNLGYYNR